MFDEATGKPMKARTGEGYDKRRGKVPCEATIGCKKGHWKENPDLSESQRQVIDLYHASVATGGACLNEAERSDWYLAVLFGRMRELEVIHARNLQEGFIATLTMASSPGMVPDE